MVEAWHWLRDDTLGEDDHLGRGGHIATNLAALRNTVISLIHLVGTHQIARTYAAQPAAPNTPSPF
jgi:hypothetical protein